MKKILIVDDEEKVRRLVEVTLSIGKFDMDGFDVCRLLKKDPDIANIYIIMLTAKGQKVDKEKGLALGADDYFVKPFSPMELIDKIDRVLA